MPVVVWRVWGMGTEKTETLFYYFPDYSKPNDNSNVVMSPGSKDLDLSKMLIRNVDRK